MKKITFLLVLTAVIFASIIVPGAKTDAAVPTVIYKNPRDAQEIGYNISTTKKISRKDLNNISKYFDDRESNRNMQLSLVTGIMVTPLNPYFGLGAGTAVSALTTYVNTHGKLVSSKLKKSSKKSFKVKINYVYKRVTSQDGYYYIDTIKIY